MKRRKKIKVGAPKGGRVHWLLWHLPIAFKCRYKLLYNYDTHNYKFIRYRLRTPIEEFTIIRTSKHCYRVVYFEYKRVIFEYKSFYSSKDCSKYLVDKSTNSSNSRV